MPSLKQRSQNRLSSFFFSAPEQDPAPAAPDDGSSPKHKRERSSFHNKLYKAGFARSSERLSVQLQSPPVQPVPVPPIPQQLQPNTVDTTFLPPPPPVPDAAATSSPVAQDPPARSRPPSRSASSGTLTPVLSTPVSETGGSMSNRLKRRSWFGAPKEEEKQRTGSQLSAWVVGHEGKLPYNLDLLLGAERIPELWDEAGNTFIYLFPRTSNKGPSFRIDSSVFAASPALTQLAFGRVYSDSTPPASHEPVPVPTGSPHIQKRKPVESHMRNLSLNDPATPPLTPELQASETESQGSSKGSRALSDPIDTVPSEVHLYLPLSLSTDNAIQRLGDPEPQLNADDIEALVGVRNFFAFLVGGSLVGTEKNPTLYRIFMQVAQLLEQYEFSNFDGSTFGEVATTSFDKYVEELNLADVRTSREKTIEGIVLGEKMRCWSLYNEAFVHGVGKYEEITELKSPKFELISPVTRNRMERASMDLYLRQKNINTRLEDFDFPAIFSGVMNSKTADERKLVRFDSWKSSFMTMRKHVMGYYKHKYGSWPPKASSKKNNLETSGLNRLVLKTLYHDFSAIYDLLVDRSNLTTRGPDGAVDETLTLEDPVLRAMRLVMSEYDRSSPPVQPAVPFDVPLMPTLSTTRKDYGIGDEKKDAKARSKKIKNDELQNILKATHNEEFNILSPFLDAYRDLERRSAHGKTIDEICDFRSGAWIFIYAVLQSLPMLVVDAPGVHFTEGVEYFLCEVPRSGVPWSRDPEANQQRNWYGVAGSTGVVSLPADIVEHGVEGIYRRSHCWEMAEKWTAHSAVLSSAVRESMEVSAVAPPSTTGAGLLRPTSRSGSPSSASRRRESVMMLGLEALPLPAGVKPDGVPTTSRPGSSRGAPTSSAAVDPLKTFDAILGSVDAGKKKKR